MEHLNDNFQQNADLATRTAATKLVSKYRHDCNWVLIWGTCTVASACLLPNAATESSLSAAAAMTATLLCSSLVLIGIIDRQIAFKKLCHLKANAAAKNQQLDITSSMWELQPGYTNVSGFLIGRYRRFMRNEMLLLDQRVNARLQRQKLKTSHI